MSPLSKQKRMIVPLDQKPDPWLKIQEPRLQHCPFAFHWTYSAASLSAHVSPCQNSITPGFEIARPDGLVNILSYQASFSIFDSSASRDLDSIIGCTVQILFDVVESVAMCFCTNLPRHSPEASHLFPTRSNRILYRSLGHHAVSKIEQIRWTLSCLISSSSL